MKKLMLMKEKTTRQLSFRLLKLKGCWQEGLAGIGVIEIILILVVLIGLVIAFKTQLTSILTSLFKTIKTDIKSI